MPLSPELMKYVEPHYPSDWTDLDSKAVDTARLLAADAVQKCGSGHPGTAMSLAPLAYTPVSYTHLTLPTTPYV